MSEPDVNLLKQVRKALNDIYSSLITDQAKKAEYQIHLLRTMIDEQPSRRQPWSYYQPQVDEEFA